MTPDEIKEQAKDACMSSNYTFLYGLWFVGNHECDWLAQLAIVEGKWRLDYRFRYNAGTSDPWDGSDKKSVYSGIMSDASEETKGKALASLEVILGVLELRFGNPVDFVRLECGPGDRKIFDELSNRSWCHVRMMQVDNVPE